MIKLYINYARPYVNPRYRRNFHTRYCRIRSYDVKYWRTRPSRYTPFVMVYQPEFEDIPF